MPQAVRDPLFHVESSNKPTTTTAAATAVSSTSTSASSSSTNGPTTTTTTSAASAAVVSGDVASVVSSTAKRVTFRRNVTEDSGGVDLIPTLVVADVAIEADEELRDLMERMLAGETAVDDDNKSAANAELLLNDDFVVLANDGIVGGAPLTTNNLTRAQMQARQDFLDEMLGDSDGDSAGDDGDDDADFSDDDNDRKARDDFDNDDDEEEVDDDDDDIDDKKPSVKRKTPINVEADNDGDDVDDEKKSEKSTATRRTYQRSEAGKSVRSELLQV